MKAIFTSARLYFRKFVIEDAPAIYKNWTSDEDVPKFLTWNTHKNLEETKSVLEKRIEEYKNPNSYRFGICLKENNNLIGAIDICRWSDTTPEIGYVLSKKYWNSGYMSESLNAFLNYMISQGYKRININADILNIGSNIVIAKNGFKFKEQEGKILESKNRRCILNKYSYSVSETPSKLFKKEIDYELNKTKLNSSLKIEPNSFKEANIKDFVLLINKEIKLLTLVKEITENTLILQAISMIIMGE